MPPAKKAAAKPKPAAPSIQHPDEACASPRVESYDVLGPGDAPYRVTRCMECGAHETSKG